VVGVPYVADHDEAGSICQFLAELDGGVLDGQEGGAFAGEPGVESAESGDQIGGLAEGGPEDAGVEVDNDVVVVAKGGRKGGFAEAPVRSPSEAGMAPKSCSRFGSLAGSKSENWRTRWSISA
jgi:hypothetical protein